MEEFKMWSLMSRNKIIHLLTVDVKVSAFNIVRQQSQFGLMKLVADTYEMATDCDIFLDIIKQMIAEKQYKEACQCATLLGLHNKFSINEFLVPLVLQDKLFFVEDFLNESPVHQIELVTFLDSIVGKPLSIRALLEETIV
ncbi:dnaj subfamily c member 17 [Holotrichia oblita]|uniref:Dnaj subfamily c member 17 n=1 Tax=Holotrichia oblita TaxID=644536 RepID=A0ACB9TUV7_HOLOL|nr:dnaj subfamily c member 17 [Holotrichia oblita]